MTMFAKLCAAPALLAAASLCAVPAAAAPNHLPRAGSVSGSETSAYGPYGYGWGGYDRYRGHRRNRVDAGDVLAGVLILGGIAAVASAASKANRRERSYPYPDQRPQFRTDARGIDGAVDLCVREVERDVRVAGVDRVERDAAGWRVSGSLATGGSFDCTIGADGRIDRIDTGAQGSPDYRSDDRQYDDDAYYSARARMDAAPVGEAQPAYPGGPLPGETEAELPEYPGA